MARERGPQSMQAAAPPLRQAQSLERPWDADPPVSGLKDLQGNALCRHLGFGERHERQQEWGGAAVAGSRGRLLRVPLRPLSDAGLLCCCCCCRRLRCGTLSKSAVIWLLSADPHLHCAAGERRGASRPCGAAAAAAASRSQPRSRTSLPGKPRAAALEGRGAAKGWRKRSGHCVSGCLSAEGLVSRLRVSQNV